VARAPPLWSAVGYGDSNGYYFHRVGETVNVAPREKFTGPSWTVSETRLFDAKETRARLDRNMTPGRKRRTSSRGAH